jgi:tetratricopeptide (TPR) repeat protein
VGKAVMAIAVVALLGCSVVAYQTSRYWLEPIALWKHSLEVTPDNYFARHNLANALANVGRHEEAMPQFRRALELVPNQPLILYHMANSLVHQRKYDEAISCYKQSIAADPSDGDVYFDLANVLALLNRYPEAEQTYNKALEVEPNFPEARVNYGNALLQQGKNAAAVAQYKQAVAEFPEMPEAHFYLASAAALGGRWDEAVYELQMTLKYRPEYADANNDLAWIKATTTNPKLRQPDQAVELASKACALTANEIPGFLDTLAVAYAASGKFGEAIDTTQKVISLCTKPELKPLVPLMNDRLSLYKQQKPYVPETPGALSAPKILLNLKPK